MATVLLCPIFNGWQGFTPAGLPLSGGFVQTYVAGTSTPAATYTTNAGNVAHQNPIQLGADGRPPSEIWLQTGIAYKFILTDSLLSPIATYDNISGIQNNPSILWITAGVTPTFVNASQFTVPGNLVSTFPTGLRVQYAIVATQYYGTVTNASFGGGLTTVTLLVDSQVLTSGLNAVNISQFTPANSALPLTIPNTASFLKGVNVGNAAQAGATTLDWYEEITFTPTWLGSILPGTTVYSEQVGYGTRVGNLFHYQISVAITSVTGTGVARIGGFPYTPNVALPIIAQMFSNSGTALGAIMTGSGVLNPSNLATGTAVTVGSGVGNFYRVSGFFPI